MQTRQVELLEATVPQLQAALTAGTVTSRDLVAMYLARIDAYDQRGPALNAISVTNGNALTEADARDAERRADTPRGPLHGIPMIVKDNYDTVDHADRGRLALARGLGAARRCIPRQEAARGRARSSSPSRTCTSSPTASPRSARCSVKPATLTRWTATPAVPAAAPVPLSPPISLPWAWAATPAARSASRHRTTASWASAGRRASASRSGIIPLCQHPGHRRTDWRRTVTDLAIVLDATVGYDPADPQTAASLGNIPKSYTDFLQLHRVCAAPASVSLTALLGTDPADAEVAAVVRECGRGDERPGRRDRRGLDPRSDRAARPTGQTGSSSSGRTSNST